MSETDSWEPSHAIDEIAAKALKQKAERVNRLEAEAATRKPDWKLWQNMGCVRVADLVALSCNIDPDFARQFYAHRFNGFGRWEDYELHECPVEYGRRFKMAISNTAWKDEAFTNVYTHWPEKQISLAEFRAWGESLPNPLTFPSEFPNASPNTAPADPDMLDARERTTLLCIIGALTANAKLDLSQPMKAGEAISAMMPDVKLSARTIGEHLKAVRDAMDSRKG